MHADALALARPAHRSGLSQIALDTPSRPETLGSASSACSPAKSSIMHGSSSSSVPSSMRVLIAPGATTMRCRYSRLSVPAIRRADMRRTPHGYPTKTSDELVVLLLRRRRALRPFQRQADLERRPTGPGVDADVAVVLLDDDAPGDVQAKPGALADGLGGEERLEDARRARPRGCPDRCRRSRPIASRPRGACGGQRAVPAGRLASTALSMMLVHTWLSSPG